MTTRTWYTSWFNSPYYHMLYRRRDHGEAAQFIDHVLRYFDPPKEAEILDLACGKGRHSIYMSKKGFRVTGIDISEQNIAYAKKFESERLKFAMADMREPFRANNFDLVLNLFTSFGYFDAAEENLNVLRSVHTNLRKDGQVLIDYLNASLLRNTLVEEETVHISDVEFGIRRSIENDIIKKRIDVKDGDRNFRFEERVKALEPEDFKAFFDKAGFDIVDTFGDYTLGPFARERSPRLILTARKR